MNADVLPDLPQLAIRLQITVDYIYIYFLRAQNSVFHDLTEILSYQSLFQFTVHTSVYIMFDLWMTKSFPKHLLNEINKGIAMQTLGSTGLM